MTAYVCPWHGQDGTAFLQPPDRHTPSAHPVTGLDEVLHQRVRLGILTITHEARLAVRGTSRRPDRW